MPDKTLKIAQELHDLLKLKAFKERRTLQDVTEEILRNEFREEDQREGGRIEAGSRTADHKDTD